MEELNSELIGILQAPEVHAVFAQVNPACADYLSQAWDAKAYEQAAVDYCELFILPKGISPMAGAWYDKGAGAEAASIKIQQAVGMLRSSVDLALPQPFQQTPAEHAGVLLFICGRLFAADDQEIQGRGLPFFHVTTSTWLQAFSKALSGNRVSPFYQAVGTLVENTRLALEA